MHKYVHSNSIILGSKLSRRQEKDRKCVQRKWNLVISRLGIPTYMHSSAFLKWYKIISGATFLCKFSRNIHTVVKVIVQLRVEIIWPKFPHVLFLLANNAGCKTQLINWWFNSTKQLSTVLYLHSRADEILSLQKFI